MKYYIDFDNTLYETAKLTPMMLKTISDYIVEDKKLNSDEVSLYVKENFDSSNDNIFSYIIKLAEKYETNERELTLRVKDILDNGKILVFDDAKRFVEKLFNEGNELILLTRIPLTNQEYQLLKLLGSGMIKYFSQIIITDKPKHELYLDFANGIFIDDNPRDINGLYEVHPKKIIRIRKPGTKRSDINIDLDGVDEYVSFDDIKF